MRDPKAHAKVLALREDAVHRARTAARFQGLPRFARWDRLTELLGLIAGTRDDHRHSTGWEYLIWTTPPSWQHTTIIPDTEEQS